ncbi:MptD family putative ECF transporter S component [Parvimonas sp. G1604]
MNASFYFFDVNQSGRIRKIIDDNATDTHMIVAHLIPDITLALITPILLFVIMFSVDIYLGIATVVLTILSAIFTMLMYGDIKFMDKYNKSLERVNSEAVEYVRGMQVLKIFKASIFSFKSFYDSIIDYSKSAYEYSKSCKNPFVIFQIILLGACGQIIPVNFFLESFKNTWLGKGGVTESALNEMIKFSTGTYGLISLLIVFILGGLGVVIGNIILKKHFKKI